MRNKGFTLIELMIVVAIIAIIAAIAIPGLLRARISANEGSAIGTMKACVTGNAQFVGQSQVDQDADGSGENGTLGELSGYSTRRGGGAPSNPSFVPSKLAPNQGAGYAGVGSKSGYNFRIYLPNSGAAVVTGTVGTGAAPTAGTAGANLQEDRWVGYGWPLTHRSTGIRCFCASNEGESYAAPNVTANTFTVPYTATTMPVFTAMLNEANAPDAKMQAQLWYGKSDATNGATDGQIWAGAGG